MDESKEKCNPDLLKAEGSEKQKQEKCEGARKDIKEVLEGGTNRKGKSFKSLEQRVQEQINGKFKPNDPIDNDTLKIDPTTNQVGKRYRPNEYPEGFNGWITHQDEIDDLQNKLKRALQDLKDNNCGDPPPGAEKLSEKDLRNETLSKEALKNKENRMQQAPFEPSESMLGQATKAFGAILGAIITIFLFKGMSLPAQTTPGGIILTPLPNETPQEA